MVEQAGRIRTNSDIKDTLNHLVRYLRGTASNVATLSNLANATLLLTTQVFRDAVEYLAVPVSMCTGYDRAVGVVQVSDPHPLRFSPSPPNAAFLSAGARSQ